MEKLLYRSDAYIKQDFHINPEETCRSTGYNITNYNYEILLDDFLSLLENTEKHLKILEDFLSILKNTWRYLKIFLVYSKILANTYKILELLSSILKKYLKILLDTRRINYWRNKRNSYRLWWDTWYRNHLNGYKNIVERVSNACSIRNVIWKSKKISILNIARRDPLNHLCRNTFIIRHGLETCTDLRT